MQRETKTLKTPQKVNNLILYASKGWWKLWIGYRERINIFNKTNGYKKRRHGDDYEMRDTKIMQMNDEKVSLAKYLTMCTKYYSTPPSLQNLYRFKTCPSSTVLQVRLEPRCVSYFMILNTKLISYVCSVGFTSHILLHGNILNLMPVEPIRRFPWISIYIHMVFDLEYF